MENDYDRFFTEDDYNFCDMNWCDLMGEAYQQSHYIETVESQLRDQTIEYQKKVVEAQKKIIEAQKKIINIHRIQLMRCQS